MQIDTVTLRRQIGTGLIIIGIGFILMGLGRLVPYVVALPISGGPDNFAGIGPLTLISNTLVDAGIVMLGVGVITVGQGLRR